MRIVGRLFLLGTCVFFGLTARAEDPPVPGYMDAKNTCMAGCSSVFYHVRVAMDPTHGDINVAYKQTPGSPMGLLVNNTILCQLISANMGFSRTVDQGRGDQWATFAWYGSEVEIKNNGKTPIEISVGYTGQRTLQPGEAGWLVLASDATAGTYTLQQTKLWRAYSKVGGGCASGYVTYPAIDGTAKQGEVPVQEISIASLGTKPTSADGKSSVTFVDDSGQVVASETSTADATSTAEASAEPSYAAATPTPSEASTDMTRTSMPVPFYLQTPDYSNQIVPMYFGNEYRLR